MTFGTLVYRMTHPKDPPYLETVKDGGECHNFFSVGMIFVMLRYFQQSPKSKSWVHPSTPVCPVIARAMS